MGTAAETATCTKDDCKEPRSGEKPWCKKHLAEYQRTYNATKEGKAEAHGYAAGVTAFRLLLSSRFQRLGSGGFTGYEVAEIVRNAQAPRPD